MFLGYAAGVGKTYQMLTEAHELKDEGVDVVVGYFEPHGRKDTIALIEGLETVPRRIVEYRGRRFEEMDTDAVLRRHPEVAVVDEFPHTNVPGSPRAKRWEDVHVLLEAGIDVLTTMNVQHLESLNDQIWQSTGVRVRETIPDWVVKQADEVVMVDLTPRALAQPARARRGLSAGTGAGRAAELLQGADARRAARAGDAPDRARGREPACPARRSRRRRRQRRPASPAHERLLLLIEPGPRQRRADSPRPAGGRLPAGGLPGASTCRRRRISSTDRRQTRRAWSVSSTSREGCRSRRAS